MEGFFSRLIRGSNWTCGQPIVGRGAIYTAGLVTVGRWYIMKII